MNYFHVHRVRTTRPEWSQHFIPLASDPHDLEQNSEEQRNQEDASGADTSDLPKLSYVDRLTMEYMTNRNFYRKYLATVEQIGENQVECMNERIITYRKQIEHIVKDICYHSSSYPKSVQDAFVKFAELCIEHVIETSDQDDCSATDPDSSPTWNQSHL